MLNFFDSNLNALLNQKLYILLFLFQPRFIHSLSLFILIPTLLQSIGKSLNPFPKLLPLSPGTLYLIQSSFILPLKFLELIPKVSVDIVGAYNFLQFYSQFFYVVFQFLVLSLCVQAILML